MSSGSVDGVNSHELVLAWVEDEHVRLMASSKYSDDACRLSPEECRAVADRLIVLAHEVERVDSHDS